MPCWYYEKKELHNTPILSIQDDIDYEMEYRYRKEGARFIIDTGTKMDLGYNKWQRVLFIFIDSICFIRSKTFHDM